MFKYHLCHILAVGFKALSLTSMLELPHLKNESFEWWVLGNFSGPFSNIKLKDFINFQLLYVFTDKTNPLYSHFSKKGTLFSDALHMVSLQYIPFPKLTVL